MNCVKEIISDKSLQADFLAFYNSYGISGLKQAMKLYTDMQQEYICRTKTSISKIRIGDIYYLEIREHDISVYTSHGTYHKYGTLNKELETLAPYRFLKCSQNCIVSLSKIRAIIHDEIVLTNGSKVHISRNYASKVILEFCRKS